MEIWKKIEHFNGHYLVSNNGQVKSLKRKGVAKDLILKPILHHSGYLMVNLYKNKKSKSIFIHILVGRAFLEVQQNKQINHKDEVKTNNTVSNLEYVTPKENCNYGIRNKKISDKQIKA
jgi:hypothetical protein